MHVEGGRPRLRPLFWAAAAAIVLRLVFGIGYWVGKPLTHDEREYLELAASLSAGRGFTYGTPADDAPVERFGRAPVYPLFLAAVTSAAGAVRVPELTAVRVVQALLGGATVLLLAMVARRAVGDRAAAIAAWGSALYPPLVWIPAYVFSEALYLPLALANVLLVDRLALAADRGQRTARLAFGCGALAGLCALTRPGHVFFAAALVVYLAARRHRGAVAALAAGAALVIAPWTARNYAEYGRVVLIASEGGITFWTGNHPLAIGEGDLAANPDIKRDNLRLRAAHPGWTPEELEAVYYREALASIGADPLRWLTLLPRKAIYLFVPAGPSYTLHSARYLAASVASWGLLLPAAIAGLVVLGRGGRRPRGVLLLAASAVAAALVFFPQERFRLSGLDPAALVLGAGALALATAPRRSPAPLTAA